MKVIYPSGVIFLRMAFIADPIIQRWFLPFFVLNPSNLHIFHLIVFFKLLIFRPSFRINLFFLPIILVSLSALSQFITLFLIRP